MTAALALLAAGTFASASAAAVAVAVRAGIASATGRPATAETAPRAARLGPAAPSSSSTSSSRLEEMGRLAPELSSQTLADALRAVDCARASRSSRRRASKDSILAVIDYTLPSTEKRLWVFDLAKPALLFHELVAHGKGSGDNVATRFSNVSGTLASSLGLYRAAEVYQGQNGYSLRLDGLTPGYNDRARKRDIVVHGAWYVSRKHARTFGRLGRSWGCPALDEEVARPIIDALRGGAWVYIDSRSVEPEPGKLLAAVCGRSR